MDMTDRPSKLTVHKRKGIRSLNGRRTFALFALQAMLLLVFLGGCGTPSSETMLRAPLKEENIQVEVLDAIPEFRKEPDAAPYIRYSAPDELGRPGRAEALLSKEMLTNAVRPDMSAIALLGMHNANYSFIRDGWVYDRCHLIGHRFGGASIGANLMTGTHALNFTYMLPWEDMIADYLRSSGERVYYRVTPLYEGDELVARAVMLEALSERGEDSLCFSVLCPNCQPGISIDYATGYVTLADDWQNGNMSVGDHFYIANLRTGKFHGPECEEAAGISIRNRKELNCHRSLLLKEGLIPCGKCRP